MNNVLTNAILWVLRKLLMGSAKSHVKKNKGSIVDAISDDNGDYDVYFMTIEERIIVDSVLIHCTKYDQDEYIPMSYVSRSWEHAMKGATMWCFKGCKLENALEVPRKLLLEYEIEQIQNS